MLIQSKESYGNCTMNKLMLVPSELDKDQYGGLNFTSASDIPSKRIQWN